MKKLFVILIIINSSILLNAQLASVDYTFKFQDEWAYVGNTVKVSPPSTAALPAIKPVNLNEEAGIMNIRQFRQFELFQKLIRQIQEEGLKVHSFKLVRESSRFDPEVLQSYGNAIGVDAQDMILKAGNGDKYLLYDIQVKCPTGEMYRLPMIAVAKIK